MIQSLLSVSFLERLVRTLYPWGVGVCVLCVFINFGALLQSGLQDYQQKETVLIMFLHVPSAWLTLGLYAAAAIGAFVGIVWRVSLSYHYCRSLLYHGAGFSLIALVTGALWGKPMWGTYWVFDARLTSTLLQAFMYFGLLLVARGAENDAHKQRNFFMLVLFGLLNIPIIKFSVNWWTTLHQPASVFRMDGPTMDGPFLMYLASSTLALSFLTFVLVMGRAYFYVQQSQALRKQFLQDRKERYGHSGKRFPTT